MTCHRIEQGRLKPPRDPHERGILTQGTRENDRALDPGDRFLCEPHGQR